MDQPDLAAWAHESALRGLARLNWLAGTTGVLWSAILAAGPVCSHQPPRVLDVATGAGDVPVGLWRRARRAGPDWQFSGCGRSPVAVEHARGLAARAGARVEFIVCDALADELPEADAVTCSLFLHHLDADQAVLLLRRLAGLDRDAPRPPLVLVS